MRSTRLGFAVCAASLLALSAGSAYAAAYKISWSGTYGAGTADVTTTGSLITSFTGEQAALPITLLPTGTYGLNDNLIFPTSSPKLDNDGFAFTDGTNHYDIYWGLLPPQAYYECSSVETSTCIGTDTVIAHELDSFSITPLSTPEPGTICVLFAGALGLLGVAGRSRPTA